jgi:hypothetical protein
MSADIKNVASSARAHVDDGANAAGQTNVASEIKQKFQRKRKIACEFKLTAII